MSTIFGSNIHNTVKPWDKVERTRFMGFDVNSYTKDCFGDTFVMRYPSGDKEVDNRGVIHFTKDGCITLNNVIYAGGQCLNTVYEAHTGNRLNKAKDAEDFMITHADDPHLQLVYFHIYDSLIAGDKWSDSNSTGTGVFITFGSTNNTRVFSQHYFWNKTHYYRVVASTANNASGWIEVKDVHQIDYDKEKHKVKLLGIKNLTTSMKNESGFKGAEVSGVEIPVWRKNNNYPGLFDSTLYNDLNDKISKCVDRSIYNFDNITYVITTTIPKLVNNFTSYVTKSQLTAQSYVTKSQLTAQSYVTKSQLTAQSYVTKSQLTAQSYVTKSQLTAQSYVTKSQLTAQSYVTKSELSAQSYIKSSALKDYVTNGRLSYYCYITKSQLSAQSYVTEAYLTSQAYLQQQDINSILEQYATTSQLNTVKSSISLNTYKISDLVSSYNALYNSTAYLQSSYNLLYSQVAYNTSMIEYLLKLHKGDSSVTVPTKAPVTSAPVTSAPVTSAPMAHIKIPIIQYSSPANNDEGNVLWGSTYVNESVNLYLNDEYTLLGNTYSNDFITLNNVSFTGSTGYSFDLVISSVFTSQSNNTVEYQMSNDKGYKLIYPNSESTSFNSGDITQYGWELERTNKKSPMTSTDANGNNISYYMYAKYRSDLSTTKPGFGGTYYTAQFQYVYPYFQGLWISYGNTWGTTISPIISWSVVYDDKSHQNDILSGTYNLYGKNSSSPDVIVALTDYWSHDNKYFAKYNLSIKKSTAAKFNSGEYKLAFGLHTCSPQVFRVDSSFPFRVI